MSNLPPPPAALIGRADALEALKALLPKRRALTITGPGGIGKTALALQLAYEMRDSLQDNAYFVDLASVLEPAFVPSAAAGAIGLTAGAEAVSAELVAGRIGASRLLLVLDNCEHLVDAAAALAATLIRGCRNVWILATSREPLRVESEHVYRLSSLEVPAAEARDPDTIYASAAARLFVTRMNTAGPDARLVPEHAPGIATICRRLDGIPLAIEFAAARAAALGIAQVAENLDDRFRFLTGDRRATLPRHQTLRATLDWSYELLAEPERLLLRHLAVFPGGFTVDAALAVLGERGTSPIGALESIANLATKSLVVQDRVPGRWRLLETIRAYAMEQLTGSGEAGEAARRQAEFFRDLFSPAGSRSLGPLGPTNVSRFVAELDNVRAALDWCFSASGDAATGVALTAAYATVWHYLALMAECADRCGLAIERRNPEHDPEDRLLMLLLLQLGVAIGYARHAREQTEAAALRAQEIAARLGDTTGIIRSLYLLWATQLFSGRVRDAVSSGEKLVKIMRLSGDDLSIAQAERILGCARQMGGDHRVARALFESALARAPAPDATWEYQWPRFNEHAMARAMLGTALWLEGRLDRAVLEVRHALLEAQPERHAFTRCNILRLALCRVEIAAGHYAAAEGSVSLLKDLSQSHGYLVFVMTADLHHGALLIKTGRFEDGVLKLRSALNESVRGGWTNWLPEFLAILSEGLIALGGFAEAAEALEEGLARSEQGGEYWYLPELLRLKGELALRQPSGAGYADAESCFRQAAQHASEQHALFWELRAALSLARLMQSQGRRAEARETLASVHGRFTEGFNTPDLSQARELLDAL